MFAVDAASFCGGMLAAGQQLLRQSPGCTGQRHDVHAAHPGQLLHLASMLFLSISYMARPENTA